MRSLLEESAGNTGRRVDFPAPIGGWNTRDSIAAMKPTDAIILDNIFPRADDVVVRKGFSEWADVPETAVGAVMHHIQSLLRYNPPSGSDKLYAANSEGIYDVTATGTKAAAAVVCTNGDWKSVNMTTAGGNFLWACNGVDKCLLFNGTSWVSLDGTSTPAITGITSTDVANVSIFKNRLILTKKNSLSFYYLGLNSISGAATEFPLGSIFNQGGYIVATANWTIDAGEGSDDHFVVITSKGEVAVYKGTDPSSASTFSLVGVYQLGVPLGRKCFVKVGGDLYVLTIGGLWPLSKALISSNINRAVAASDRIVAAWNSYSNLYSTYTGWDATLLSKENMLLINVPIKYDGILKKTYSYQFVMNTLTGAWARFSGQNADCWCELGGVLYFASENKVYKAWSANNDDGASISVSYQGAFHKWGTKANKRLSLFRVVMFSPQTFSISFGIDTDYNQRLTQESLTSFSTITDKWDTAVWDTAKWAGEVIMSKWKSVNHTPGGALSLRLKFYARNANIRWSAVEAIVEPTISLL